MILGTTDEEVGELDFGISMSGILPFYIRSVGQFSILFKSERCPKCSSFFCLLLLTYFAFSCRLIKIRHWELFFKVIVSSAAFANLTYDVSSCEDFLSCTAKT